MPIPDGAQGGPLEPEQAGGEPGQAEQADAYRLPIAHEELEDAAHDPCLRHTGGLPSGKERAAPRETARDQEPGAEDMLGPRGSALIWGSSVSTAAAPRRGAVT